MFVQVMTTSAAAWPCVCYATHATAEKLCKERMPDARAGHMSRPLSALLAWACTFVVLVLAAHARATRPSLWLEYSYVGMVGYAMWFFRDDRSRRDWERFWVAVFVYACAVYVASDGPLLRYAVVFCVFASARASLSSARVVWPEAWESSHARTSSALRAVEIFVLSYVASAAVWRSGTMDPLVVGLNFATVYGDRLHQE